MVILGSVQTLCNACSSLIKANVIEKENAIFFSKECSKTEICIKVGKEDVLISKTPEKYKKAMKWNIEKTKYGMGIIEIIQSCNIKCNTCIAGSYPDKEGILYLDQIKEIIELLKFSKNIPEILVISGGEPTTHPQFKEIIKYICESNFNHVIIISNGIDISKDESLARFFSSLEKKIEVYLQFDSLSADVLINLRGEDLSSTRINALNHLETYKIPTTLVNIVKRGLNEHEIKESIDIAMSYSCTKGITFQPIRETGRHSDFSINNTITLSEVCEIIESMSTGNVFSPHHLNPKHIEYCYIDKTKDISPKTIEKIQNFKIKNQRFLILPKDEIEDFPYENSFRIMVVEYMDKYNFDVSDIDSCAIGMIGLNGEITPLEMHYMPNNIRSKVTNQIIPATLIEAIP